MGLSRDNASKQLSTESALSLRAGGGGDGSQKQQVRVHSGCGPTRSQGWRSPQPCRAAHRPPPILTPLHLCSHRRTGTRNPAPAAARARGLRTAGGARDKTDVRPAHVACPRPGRSPVARISHRREVARGRPALTRPERPLASRTWART